MLELLQGADLASAEELAALPSQLSARPSAGSSLTARKQSPLTTGCAAAAIPPRRGAAAAHRQPASGEASIFDFDAIQQASCLSQSLLHLLANGVMLAIVYQLNFCTAIEDDRMHAAS